MPPDFMSLFGTPTLIRRYAALHAESAKIFSQLANFTEEGDKKGIQECMDALAQLADQQTEGRGHVAAPSA
jgi:hypothetical protein